MRHRLLPLLFIVLCLLTACAAPAADPTATPLPSLTLIPTAKIPTATVTNPATAMVLPTNTAQPTLTATPSKPPTTPTAKTEIAPPIELMDSQYIVLKDTEERVLLIEIGTGKWRVLDPSLLGEYRRVMKIADDGCTLVVEKSDRSIIRIAITGNYTTTMLTEGWYSGEDSYSYMSLSYSDKWLAYIVGRGYQDYDSFEKQELHLLEIGTGRSSQLSENDGVWGFQWAPNELAVAFSDFDSNGINQIFVAKGPDWQKKQLSDFKVPDIRVENITWSPDGAMLAFTQENTTQRNFTAAVITLNGKKTDLQIGEAIWVGAVWWQGTSTVGIIADRHGQNQSEIRSMFFVSSGTGEVMERVDGEMMPDGNIGNAAALSETKAVFFSSGTFNVYDLSEKLVTRAFPMFFDIREWLVSPSDFIGEESCGGVDSSKP